MSGVRPTNLLESINRKKSFSQKGINDGRASVAQHFSNTLEPWQEHDGTSLTETIVSTTSSMNVKRSSTVAPYPPYSSSMKHRRSPVKNVRPHRRSANEATSLSGEFYSGKPNRGQSFSQRQPTAEHSMEDEDNDIQMDEERDKVTDLCAPAPVAPATPVQERWKKARAAAKAITRLKGIEKDLRMFGAKHVADDDEEDPRYAAQHDDAAKRKKPWVLLPNSRLRRTWELVIILLLLYIVVVVPVRVCFDIESGESAANFDMFVDILFIADVFMNMVCAYTTSNGELVVDQRRIILHYARTWMVLDIVASIPFYQVIDVSSNGGDAQLNRLSKVARLPKLVRLIRLLRLLKLLRVFKLVRYFNQWEHLNVGINLAFTRMFKVTFGVFMVTHMIGCFWYFVAWVGYDGLHPESWVFRHGIQDEDDVTKYLTAVYWSFSTLTTVGFGDISANTNQERVFSIICMLVGVSWYAFVISTISSIINMFDRRSAEQKRKTRLIVQFMRETKVPFDLRRRILQYFEYLQGLESTEADSREMENVLSMLSTQLRTDVTLHVHRNLIPQIPFFDDKTPQFIAACVSLLRPLHFRTGDYISTRGQHADEVYFLISGRACVVLPSGQRFKSIVEGSYFGEIGCMLSEIHRVSIVAATECQVYALSKADLKQLMDEYPDVACEIRATAKCRIEHLNMKKHSEGGSHSERNFETSFPGVAVQEDESDFDEGEFVPTPLSGIGSEASGHSVYTSIDMFGNGRESPGVDPVVLAHLEDSVANLRDETKELRACMSDMQSMMKNMHEIMLKMNTQ